MIKDVTLIHYIHTALVCSLSQFCRIFIFLSEVQRGDLCFAAKHAPQLVQRERDCNITTSRAPGHCMVIATDSRI